MGDVDESTKDFFQKLPGYDTLRMIIAKRSVLVEGRSDELIVQDSERTQDVDISYDLIGILPYSLLKSLQNGETA